MPAEDTLDVPSTVCIILLIEVLYVLSGTTHTQPRRINPIFLINTLSGSQWKSLGFTFCSEEDVKKRVHIYTIMKRKKAGLFYSATGEICL